MPRRGTRDRERAFVDQPMRASEALLDPFFAPGAIAFVAIGSAGFMASVAGFIASVLGAVILLVIYHLIARRSQ